MSRGLILQQPESQGNLGFHRKPGLPRLHASAGLGCWEIGHCARARLFARTRVPASVRPELASPPCGSLTRTPDSTAGIAKHQDL